MHIRGGIKEEIVPQRSIFDMPRVALVDVVSPSGRRRGQEAFRRARTRGQLNSPGPARLEVLAGVPGQRSRNGSSVILPEQIAPSRRRAARGAPNFLSEGQSRRWTRAKAPGLGLVDDLGKSAPWARAAVLISEPRGRGGRRWTPPTASRLEFLRNLPLPTLIQRVGRRLRKSRDPAAH
jgi:hypothetical protein